MSSSSIPSSDSRPLLGSQIPRIGTPRRPEFRTVSAQLVELAAMCGVELETVDGFTWQSNAAAVALEVDDKDRWVHRVVVVVVSRQAGKTELMKFRILAGLYVFGDGLVVHTAQDRDLPRQTFEELVAMIRSDPWLSSKVAGKGGIRTANGQERIRLLDGSTYRIFAPREGKPVRGRSAGLLCFDEAREQTDRRLWTAALYTVRAHPNPQIWVVSNAGDDTSIVLNDLRDRGRVAAEDPHADARICYLEWSAKDDRPLDDRAGWVEAMPGLGYLTDEDTVLDELRADDEAGFRTEALCQWVAGSMRHAVPVTAWDDCAGEMPILEPGHPVWFGVELDPWRESGALAAVAWHGGRLVSQILERWDSPTEAAMAERIVEWANEWRPEVIGLDPWTTNDEGGLAEYLEGHQTRMISGRAWAVASSQLWELVTSRTVLHGGDEILDREIEQAGRSDAGDGSWRITRKDSTGPIPGVLALTRALALAGGPGPGEFGIVTTDT